jgi:RHS repeat-associated protein
VRAANQNQRLKKKTSGLFSFLAAVLFYNLRRMRSLRLIVPAVLILLVCCISSSWASYTGVSSAEQSWDRPPQFEPVDLQTDQSEPEIIAYLNLSALQRAFIATGLYDAPMLRLSGAMRVCLHHALDDTIPVVLLQKRANSDRVLDGTGSLISSLSRDRSYRWSFRREGVLAYIRYDAWGTLRNPADCIANPTQLACENKLTFTGHLFDSESALYYFNARYYDSSLGQFTTTDPAVDLSKYHDFFASGFAGTTYVGKQALPSMVVGQHAVDTSVVKTEGGFEPSFSSMTFTPDPVANSVSANGGAANAAAWNAASGKDDLAPQLSLELRPQYVSTDTNSYPAADPANPGMWYSYAYALNSPVNYTDPLGLSDRLGVAVEHNDRCGKDPAACQAETKAQNEALGKAANGAGQLFSASYNAEMGLFTGATAINALENAGVSESDIDATVMTLQIAGIPAGEFDGGLGGVDYAKLYGDEALTALREGYQTYQNNPRREAGFIKFDLLGDWWEKRIAQTKPLQEWLKDYPDVLKKATEQHEAAPEWQGIEPQSAHVRYVPEDQVRQIRKMPGESGGHHPHSLALGGPPGQEITPTNETRTVKNEAHKEATKLQMEIIRIVKKQLGLL